MADNALIGDSLSISITAEDLQRSIRYYTEGLGFEIIDRVEHDGAMAFVMMRAGQTMVGLGQDDFAKGRNRAKGIGMRVWITTSQDIAALAERVTRAGITIDEGPAPLPWGPMAIALTDPDGFRYTISAPR